MFGINENLYKYEFYFQGQSKLRTVVDKIMPVDPRTYGEKLLNKIRHNVSS